MCLHAQHQSTEGWSKADVYLKAVPLVGRGADMTTNDPHGHLSIFNLAWD